MSVFLFPGLDALFVTSKMKRWLDKSFVKADLDKASEILSNHTLKEENLSELLLKAHRPHLQDFDRTLIALTTVQVSIAQALMAKGHEPKMLQGCSHGDIARSVLCQSLRFEDAIAGLWNFSLLRGILPAGLTATIRNIQGAEFTDVQMEWIKAKDLPLSSWSQGHGTVACEQHQFENFKSEAQKLGLKVGEMLAFPVHTPMLKPVFELLDAATLSMEFKSPSVKTFSSVWLKNLNSAEDIRKEALASAVLPVRWVETLDHLYRVEQVRHFVNIGPSNSLTSWTLNNEKYPGLEIQEAWDLLGDLLGDQP